MEEDLFSNFRSSSKSTRSKRESFEGIFISPEMFIGAVIIFIIGIVLSFSVGVEQGKRIGRSQVVVKEKRSYAGKGQNVRKKSGKTLQGSLVKKKQPVNKKVSSPKTELQKKIVERKSGKYAVQLVVYKNSRYAVREMAYLKKQKYPFFKEEKSGKIILFAGPFSTLEEAKKAEKELKSRYKDCFIKLMKK